MLQATAVATPGLLNIYPVSEGKPYEYIPEKNKKKWDEALVSSPSGSNCRTPKLPPDLST